MHEMKQDEGLAQAVPDDRTELAKRVSGAMDISTRLSAAAEELSSVIDRLCGPEGEAKGMEPKPVRGGLLGQMDDQHEAAMESLTSVEASVRRLNTLI